MPKRIIDSDRLEKSEKLSKCMRPQRLPIGVLYPWLIARADRNGNFEIPSDFCPCPDLWKNNFVKLGEIWCDAISDFHRRGLLFLYKKNGKTYAHVMGSEARGLLPKRSELSRFPTDIPKPPPYLMRRYAVRFSYACTKSGNRELIASYSRQGIGLGENGRKDSPDLRFRGNGNGKSESQRQLQKQRQEQRQDEVRREAWVGAGPVVTCVDDRPDIAAAKRMAHEALAALAGKRALPAAAPLTEAEHEERRAALRRQAEALLERRALAATAAK